MSLTDTQIGVALITVAAIDLHLPCLALAGIIFQFVLVMRKA